MGLTSDMLKKIKEEIANDPQNIGYSGKTDAQIANLLSSSILKSWTNYEMTPSPINRILNLMTDGPNFITASEVSQAKITT